MADAYDVIVIGTGAGGGTVAQALAPTGARILLVERGGFVPQEPENWDPAAVWQQLRYRTTERWVDETGQLFRPYMHYCVGGNTKFWTPIFFLRTAFLGRFGLAKVGIGSSVVRNHCLGCDFQVCTMLHRRDTSTFVFSTST